MTLKHLEILRRELDRNHWKIQAELPGDDLRISGSWEVVRQDGNNIRHIVFEGFDEMNCLPIDKAYACHVKGSEGINLYFGKLSGKTWPIDLRNFIQTLNDMKQI